MRELLKRILFSSFLLFTTSLVIPGLKVNGGAVTYIYAGAILAIASLLLDPIIKAVTLPFNILTLGLLSFLTTAASLFALTFLYSNVNITAFQFSNFSFLGLDLTGVHVSTFLSYIIISATIYFSNKILGWIVGN